MLAFLRKIRGHQLRVALSALLALAEAIGWVALPFLVGTALDDFMDGSLMGLIVFAALGLVTMLVAVARRLHDARLYARIYETTAVDAVDGDEGLSEKTARLNMLREVVEFLEHSMPVLIESLVAFVGTLVFLAALSLPVFLTALVMSILIAAIYGATTRRTLALNRGYNDEYERQVDVLRRNDTARLRRHVGLLNRWTIQLSDIEAINTALSLTLIVGLQVVAVVAVTLQGLEEGKVLSVVLYVFEFSAVAAFLPDSWQEYLRLRDIVARLEEDETPASEGEAAS